MQRFTAATANKLTADMVAKASGDAITTGTVTGYLVANTGTNTGKWWNASGATWAATETSSGAMTFKGGSSWQVSIVADAWTHGVAYTFYATESGSLHVPYSSTVLEIDYQTLPSETIGDYRATGFAVAGDEMTLADDAITAEKYDQTTAFPLTTADSSAIAGGALSTHVDDATEIYNLALGLIDEYNVESGDTSSKQYELCNRYYAQVLKKVLSKHPWNEAMRDTVVMQESVGPVGSLTYRYQVPSDSLQVRAIGSDLKHWEVKEGYILTDYTRTPNVWTTATDYVAGQYVQYSNITYLCDVSHTSDTWAGDAANWTSQGDDYGVIDLEYIFLLTDTTKMSGNLIDAIAQELAIKVATGITGNGDVKKMLLEEYKTDILPNARSIDSVEGRLKPIYNSKWLRSRS